MAYEIGARVGDYEVLQVLGAGGMGLVYKVRNVISDRVEAMKVLLPNLQGDPDLADRFMREIKVQAALTHPNIAALHTAIRIENQLLMLMEFVEGTTIEAIASQGRIPIAQAAGYMIQVLSALAYAHSHGVVHRDLKPANMIVTPQGTVKLMDFGIARFAADRKLTQTGRTLGSLYYMSPEQIKGLPDIDARSDLYSLGVAFYEIITGARPFQGDSEYSIMAAHLEHTPVPPVQLDPSLPPAVNEIIMMALEKDPAKRFRTAEAFSNALQNVIQVPTKTSQPVAVTPPPPPTPAVTAQAPPPPVMAPAAPPPQKSRRGLWIAVGSLATIAVLIGAATQIPKFKRASADSAPASQAITPTVQEQPSVPAAQAPVPEAVPAPAAAEPAPQPSQQAAPRPAPKIQQRMAVQQPAPQQQVPQPIVTQAPASAPAQVVQQQPVAQPAPQPAAQASSAAQLNEIRDQFILLAARGNAVRTTLATMQRQQAASGLGLRQDIVASQERMSFFMGEADSALRRGDAPVAKKSLDSAERECSKIEKFLGR